MQDAITAQRRNHRALDCINECNKHFHARCGGVIKPEAIQKYMNPTIGFAMFVFFLICISLATILWILRMTSGYS